MGCQGDSIVGGRGGGGRGGGGFRGGGGGGGGIPRGDSSWDALFRSAGQPVQDGFMAEMAIPFKSLRYPARASGAAHTWGFQIVRQIRGKDETVVWSPVSRDIAGFLPQMGVLDGMAGLSTSRNLEMQPTFTAFRFGTLDEALGRVIDGDPQPEIGVNFKYGVTPNLTADFTLNPDFSQIESDRPQVEVNQRFALFFPELRPFFLEGAEIFQIQAPVTVVHTRTIVDPLYGAKLTGKAGKMTLGVLFANDQGASLGVDDVANPTFGQSAQTFVGRLRYDLYSESFVGAIVTDREFLDGYSRLVGMDSNFRVGRTHQFGFRALGTDRRDPVDTERTDGYTVDIGFRKWWYPSDGPWRWNCRMPRAGVHYPGNYAAMRAWFPDDAACRDYLDWLRWPAGFRCPSCDCTTCWELGRGERRCTNCRRRVSRTAGTIFQDTRTPLTVWFAAAWPLTTQKNGISALGLKRVLGLGSYQTAWTMLHRYRSARVRPGRERLNGDVETDESFFGGVKPGKRGRGAAGKVLVAIAVEQRSPTGYGRARMQVISDATSETLRECLLANIAPGAVVISDGLGSYPAACGEDYRHTPFNVRASGLPAHVPLPGVHRVAALAKRWLLGTHQGAVEADHLQAYLNEFCFRFNRRHSRARGLLFYRLMHLAVGAPPLTYRHLVVNPQPKRRRPIAPQGPRPQPGTLALPPAGRPWRQVTALE